MAEPVMIIDGESVAAVRRKLDDPGKAGEAVEDVKKMLEIKQALLWRSDAIAPCCGSLAGFTARLTREVDVLGGVLKALENGDTEQGVQLLEEYAHILEESCELGQPNYS